MPLDSLSLRIIALVVAVSIGGTVLLSWTGGRLRRRQLEEANVTGATRLSEVLTRSTRLGMLHDRRSDVYATLERVAAQDGIERIRIYNKKGTVAFSTEPAEIGLTVDKQAEACTSCHNDGTQPVSRPQQALARTFSGPQGERTLGLITPVLNERTCQGSACHAGPEEQQILGVIDLQLSLGAVDRAAETQGRQLLALVSGVMLTVAAACGLFVWRFVHRPVQGLIRGTERIRAGQLEHRIAAAGRSEIGQLAASFNDMSQELAAANRQLTDWARRLEERVDEKTRDLQLAQCRIVHSEKMASLGALSSVVAHEINNPLSGVLTYAKLARRLLREGQAESRSQDIDGYLGTVVRETARCGQIARNLLELARRPASAPRPTEVKELVDRALLLIGHKLKLQSIELRLELQDRLPRVPCDAEQIEQALLAVMMNAVEAMPEGGRLKIGTRHLEPADPAREAVAIDVSDTGPGIPADVEPQIFQPFYTTKEEEHGIGLGLSVVQDIVHRHRGRIEVAPAAPGTTVTLCVPVRPPGERRDDTVTATGGTGTDG